MVEERDSQISRLNYKINEQNRQLETMASFSTQLKQHVESLKYEVMSERERFAAIQGQDLAKQIIQLKHEIEVLRSENRAKTEEIGSLKEGIKQAMQQDNGTMSNHFGNLLENQSKEVCRLKKMLEEHERRERICQRKWNSLLQENLHLQEKVQAGGQQMLRQREQLQGVIITNERKLIEASKRLA